MQRKVRGGSVGRTSAGRRGSLGIPLAAAAMVALMAAPGSLATSKFPGGTFTSSVVYDAGECARAYGAGPLAPHWNSTTGAARMGGLAYSEACPTWRPSLPTFPSFSVEAQGLTVYDPIATTAVRGGVNESMAIRYSGEVNATAGVTSSTCPVQKIHQTVSQPGTNVLLNGFEADCEYIASYSAYAIGFLVDNTTGTILYSPAPWHLDANLTLRYVYRNYTENYTARADWKLNRTLVFNENYSSGAPNVTTNATASPLFFQKLTFQSGHRYVAGVYLSMEVYTFVDGFPAGVWTRAQLDFASAGHHLTLAPPVVW